MSEHPIRGLMQTVMSSIKDMIDVDTIVGNPIETKDGTTIIPISKVGFGFASGGSDFGDEKNASAGNTFFGGGSGAGVSITPIAFLSVYQGSVKLISVAPSTSAVDKLIDYVPDIVDKISSIVSKKGSEENEF